MNEQIVHRAARGRRSAHANRHRRCWRGWAGLAARLTKFFTLRGTRAGSGLVGAADDLLRLAGFGASAPILGLPLTGRGFGVAISAKRGCLRSRGAATRRGGRRRSRRLGWTLEDANLNALERIVRHRGAAGSAVAQRTDGHARSIVAGIFAVVSGRCSARLEPHGKSHQRHRHALGAADLIVAEPRGLKARAGEALVLDVVRGELLERLDRKGFNPKPGATRPAQGTSAKFISPRERMWVLICSGTASVFAARDLTADFAVGARGLLRQPRPQVVRRARSDSVGAAGCAARASRRSTAIDSTSPIEERTEVKISVAPAPLTLATSTSPCANSQVPSVPGPATNST